MVFLSWWGRPSVQAQQTCINNSDGFNYPPKFRGATAKHISSLLIDDQEDLSKDGFVLNHSRVPVGSGLQDYDKAKTALQSWRHFGFNWTFVDPKTRIQPGIKFCVCVKEVVPWLMMPLQVVYVSDVRNPRKTTTASFAFGSGTLQGHLLAGEERFSIELDENNNVWYEILSFSKPAHLLSVVGYPYVRLSQKYFAHQGNVEASISGYAQVITTFGRS